MATILVGGISHISARPHSVQIVCDRRPLYGYVHHPSLSPLSSIILYFYAVRLRAIRLYTAQRDSRRLCVCVTLDSGRIFLLKIRKPTSELRSTQYDRNTTRRDDSCMYTSCVLILWNLGRPSKIRPTVSSRQNILAV